MVRAKFKVDSIELYSSPVGAGSVKLSPVYKYQQGVSGNACEENKSFWDATPSGQIQMHINNPAGFKPFVDAFHSGKAFYVDFSETDI